MRLADVTLGDAVSAGDAIAAGARGDEFVRGDIVYVGMSVGSAPPGAAVRILFVGGDGTELGADEKKVPVGADSLVFQSPDTSAWEPGEYRVEIRVGEEKLAERRFTLRATESGAGDG